MVPTVEIPYETMVSFGVCLILGGRDYEPLLSVSMLQRAQITPC